MFSTTLGIIWLSVIVTFIGAILVILNIWLIRWYRIIRGPSLRSQVLAIQRRRWAARAAAGQATSSSELRPMSGGE